MITVFLLVALALVVGVLTFSLIRRERARSRTTTHEGLEIERDRTTRAEASGGIFGVHGNHGSWPGVEENTKYFG